MHVTYINIFVSDLDRAVAFYRDTMGLPFQFTAPEHGYAAFLAGSIRLGIATPGEERPELIGRQTGIGLEVADVEAEHARLTRAGVKFTMPPTRQPWGTVMAMFADPDGNIFYLNQATAPHAA
jgi:predicted enzyme related to lactoylglutathione lyase